MNGLAQAPYNEQLYVKGTFNGWGDDTPMAYLGKGEYQAVVCLSADQHSFKISDQQGSEHLTFSADKYKAVSCAVGQALPLMTAKGIGNDLTFLAPETGLYTISLTVVDAVPSLMIALGGENSESEPSRELVQAEFDIQPVACQLRAKPEPVLAPKALFEQLAINVIESAPFVFGDNVDGYYEGVTHGYVAAGKYRHKQGWYLGTFASFVDGEINNRNNAPDADILPYGVTHNYASRSTDTLMLFSQQRAAALSVTSEQAEVLAIAPQLNLAINASTLTTFDRGVVYALDPSLRQDNTPSFIALCANKPFRIKETTFAEQPALKDVVHLSGNHVKPVIETLHSESNFTVYLAFAETEAEAIEQAKQLLDTDGFTQHQQQTYDMLTQSYLWTSDLEYNRALMWAKVSGKVFVSNEFGKGIWAGLPWFKDCWGRDSFIALPGITLVNGDFADAKTIIDNFASMQLTDKQSINYGRIPNRVTSLTNIIYNTTDGTPWMVREVWDYLRYSGDLEYAKSIYPVVQTYIDGIEKNYLDQYGLMTHRDPDTWMDAKLEGKLPWSARGNRANDIQALWYTSLKVAVELARLNGDENGEQHYQSLADNVQSSFQSLFWDEQQELLADRLHQDNSRDLQVRPNQLMTLTVPFDNGLVEAEIGAKVVQKAVSELLFPWGITSLSQYDPDFHPYHANREEYHKDAAYHNGTIWGWNAGFTVSSLIQYGYADFAYKLTKNLSEQILSIGHRGAMSENLDAFLNTDGKLTTTGTYAQAWSVSEFTRNGYQDYLGFAPNLLAGKVTLAPCLPAQWQSFHAVLRFGQTNALNVSFEGHLDGHEVYHLAYQQPAEETLELVLTANDKAKYLVEIEAGMLSAVVKFNPLCAEAEINGKSVALACIQRSYQPQIGHLAFAMPDTDIDFPVLQANHVLQQQVEASDLAKAVD
ncbi:amylo-alpha-1,6-glucosidase [Photobacterium sp. SDRW27]|uniref:amylo-alpha-1,6-glucosidase n=1 Tax=Photobacterium obscurum TaxID=2829490 RepID=UPI002242D976|nr:amylo-alpha-1,6-glucosidase [Photobacterium obscurum]MCW8328639.1 amylo-alpha-1,6-glucosidase [Photobacterium obscurum]